MGRIKTLPTLARRAHPLASASEQRARLDRLALARSFGEAVGAAGYAPLEATGVSVLQINVGKRCTKTSRWRLL